MGGDVYRVYFTSRDRENRSHVGWVAIDLNQPDRALAIAEQPLLSPGPPGSFDDAGTTLSCVVRHRGKRYFYYIGWSLRTSVPYHLSIGLALGDDDESAPSATKLPGPIIDRSRVDPLFCTAPTVRYESGRWRMWYVSGLGWIRMGDGVTPSYNTRYADSEDGVDWRRHGLVVLEPQGDELGFSRPSVVLDSDGYHMWYSTRASTHLYRLGLARSTDGLVWTREDANAGLDPAAEGWDSEMIAYPHVFDHGADRFMVYCGNGFGKSGFGLAVQSRHV